MNKEEMIEDFINYLNRDIQSKVFLTYREQDEWKDYINRIINNQVKEKDKEIERLNNIINEIFEWMQNKYDNSDLTGFTVSFQELQDLKELKEGK